MSLIITASLVAPDGKALAQRDVQVCIFTATGTPKVIGIGRTDDAGKLAIASRFVPPVDYQPRLQLQVLRGESYVEASEDLVSFTDGACSFGKVTFDPVAPFPSKFVPPDGIVPEQDAKAPSGDGDGGEVDAIRKAVTEELDLFYAKELATRTGQLQAEKAAALAALTQQHAQALATRTSELTADKSAALAALAQQHAQALATRTSELTAERSAALAALTQQHAQALAARTSELTAERTAALVARDKQHAEAIAARDSELHALTEQLKAVGADGPHETTIEELAQTTASQIQRVQQSLRDAQGGLRLGNVALQLKVLPGRTGGRVALPQRSDIEKVGAGALGSLDLAFVPQQEPSPPRQRLKVPRVLGYTEALARRKLAERHLGAEVVYQMVTTAAEHGRVVLQRPLPDAATAEGSTILIAIGRQDEHDPRPT